MIALEIIGGNLVGFVVGYAVRYWQTKPPRNKQGRFVSGYEPGQVLADGHYKQRIRDSAMAKKIIVGGYFEPPAVNVSSEVALQVALQRGRRQDGEPASRGEERVDDAG